MERQRVYAEIDLGAVRDNIRMMHGLTKEGCRVIPVIKADGYGHGAVPIAKMLEKEPYIERFAVAAAEEAEELYAAGIRTKTMLLGLSLPETWPALIRIGCGITVSSYEEAEGISAAAGEEGLDAEIIIAVDTGMGRIGFLPDGSSAETVKAISSLAHVRIAGIFTHFAKADEEDTSHARGQYEKMRLFLEKLDEAGVRIPLKTVSNSAGILTVPEANFDAVRAGILMYGLTPSEEMGRELEKRSLTYRPAMTIKSRIMYIKTVEPGTSISYGGTYTAEEPRRIATIPVGYADGYPRQLSGKGSVLIHGKRAPITGRVCMDQFMVDVTDIPEAARYDEAVLLGADGDDAVTAEELGALSGRFNYELVCCISKRVPRVYKDCN